MSKIKTNAMFWGRSQLFGLLLLMFSGHLLAASVDKVTTYKDASGWKVQVNGDDFYIKGVVWGHTPPGYNYTYNLWAEPDEYIQEVLDHDFGLMADAGINAIRSFAMIPTKWVTYIYEKHGIMSIINPLMGRYGALINGVWKPFTDYSDPATRQTLKAEVLEIVNRYKDVPGVLMFALGNESNYGLSWSSFEIENLPVGEQQREKAKYLYSLFGEVVDAAKERAPEHLFTIVNGDIQYLDLIAEYLQNMDLLGTNIYRGIGFTELWKDVSEEFDRPIVFMEFGSDAFNAKNFAEDEAAQASFLRGQWREMYNQSYGNGGYGNSVGGFVFQWRDEWWKYKQDENLDVQDRTASWANGGYTFDFVEGANNMNEEWFGITRIGKLNEEGVYESEPRMAYDVLTEIWSIDPYATSESEINTQIQNVDMERLALKSDVRALKSAQAEQDKFRLVGGSLSGDFIIKGEDQNVEEDGEDGLRFSDGQMVFLDFEFEPTSRIRGDFSINILANVSQSDFDFRYGDRGEPVTVVEVDENEFGVRTTSDTDLEGRERIEIYDFQATYEGDQVDLISFYHVPRFHWGYEGDFYGLLRETTDMEGQDIWNDKAPSGIELVGKKDLDGLKFVVGPEVYWGANPKALLKYEFDHSGTDYAIVLSEDIAERDGASGATEATKRQSRQATIYAARQVTSDIKVELGGIISGTDRIGETFDRQQFGTGNIIEDEIEFEDTLGFKAKVTGKLFGNTNAYLGLNYAGLVADGGAPLREFGTELPYSELGNKEEVEAGVMFVMGDYTIFPRYLYRDNIVEAAGNVPASINGTTVSPGINPRNQDEDPFAVRDNREAESGEIYITYDPTPATDFYHWNADLLEDAAFAYNLGFTRTFYRYKTDSFTVFSEEFDTNISFGEGLPAEDVWLAKSKMIFNPASNRRYVLNLEAGRQQATASPEGDTVEYYSINGKAILNNKHIISGFIEKDAFGQYDFFEEFNVTFPWQYKLDYAILLDQLKDEKKSSKFGMRFQYRTLDENSPADVFNDGENEYQFEVVTYFKFAF